MLSVVILVLLWKQSISEIFFFRLFVVRPMVLKYGSKHSLLRGCRWQKNIESRYMGRSLHTQQFTLKFKLIVYYIQVLVSRVL